MLCRRVKRNALLEVEFDQVARQGRLINNDELLVSLEGNEGHMPGARKVTDALFPVADKGS